MLYSVILRKIVARKVSSQVALRNCSKVLRGARVHKVMGWKNIQKIQKQTFKSIKRLLWMMNLIHFKLMIFMLLNNCYLFIFMILFICLLILTVLALPFWGQPFLVVASRGYCQAEMCWLLLLMASHRRLWDQGVGISGHGPQALVGCSVVVVLGLSCYTVCEVFLDQGSNLYPWCWPVDS